MTGLMSPAISVVIPTYQRVAVLAHTLARLKAQAFRGFEIIVVSQTPGEPERRQLEQWHQSEIPMRIVWQPEPSASQARNRGLLEARSEIVLFLDDDVTFDETLLSAHTRGHGLPGVTGVAGQVRTSEGVTSKRSPLSRLPSVGWLFFPMNYSKPG